MKLKNWFYSEIERISNRIIREQRLFKNSAYLIVSTLLTKLSVLGLFLIATRILSLEEMGRFVIFTSLFAIFQPALNFGTQAYLSKEVAKDNKFARRNFGELFFLQFIIAIISLMVLLVILFVGNYGYDTILIIIMFVPVFFLFGPLYLADAIFLGLENARLSATFQISLNIGLLIVGSVTLILTEDLRALAFSYFICFFAVTIISLITLRRRLNGFEIRKIELNTIKSLVVVLFPFAAVSFLDAIKNRVDVFILSNLVMLNQLAIYGAAYRIFDGIRTLTSYPFSMAAYPRMSFQISHREKKSKIYREYSFIAGIIGITSSTLLFLFSDLIVRILYPVSYSSSTFILKLLSVSILFDTLNAISGRFLFVLDKPGLVSSGVLIAATINIISNLILIPSHGIVGAAIATNITYFVLFGYLILSILFLLKKSGRFIF